MITPILTTSILVSEDGTGTFIKSSFSEHSHDGLSLEDIAYIVAMEASKTLGIDLRKQINELDDDTIVYTFKHDTGEITIFTVISLE